MSETLMTRLAIAKSRLNEVHWPNVHTGKFGQVEVERECSGCGDDWPCDTAVLILDAQPDTRLREAAQAAADWLSNLQSVYHGLQHHAGTVHWEDANWTAAYIEDRDTCKAGMCGDYREHRDALRAALAETDPKHIHPGAFNSNCALCVGDYVAETDR